MPQPRSRLASLVNKLKSYSHYKSVLVIIVVGSLGIAASQALFRDIERSQKGTFVVGTLDLAVSDDEGGAQPQSIQIQKLGATKEVAGEKTYQLRNVGSLDGLLEFRLDRLVNYENGCNEPEALVDTSCDNPGPDQGELGQNIILEVVVGEADEAQVVATSDLATANQDQFQLQWQAHDSIVVSAGQTLPVTLRWKSKPGGLGNEVQSDSVVFDFTYELRQIINQ